MFLEPGHDFFIIRELRQICQQSPCGKVHREFTTEIKCDIGSLSGKRCLHHAADHEIDRNVGIALCGEFRIRERLDNKCLITPLTDPDIDGVLAVRVGKGGIILKE